MTLAQDVFRTLADGGVHSGEALAERAGVTRSAVWKAIEQLREMGLEIAAQTHRGYQLVAACEALDAQRIHAGLAPSIRHSATVDVEWEIESTNGALLSAVPPQPGRFVVLLAENQTGGRGRRGRAWQSALGSSLCLSIATSFEPLPRDLPALTLVIGVCVREALKRRGAHDLGLKWPNDIVFGNRKVAGILLELGAELDHIRHVVLGIGIDVNLTLEEMPEELRSIATSLRIEGGRTFDRADLAATVVSELDAAYGRLRRGDFHEIGDEWMRRCSTLGKRVSIRTGDRVVTGRAESLNEDGALLVRTDHGRLEHIIGGDVSLAKGTTP